MRKILIIDDFEPFRNMVRRVVERLGYQAFVSAGGQEGLEVFARENPEIVITDFQMPDVDGLGVLVAIKEKSPETEVIVLTGFATEKIEAELLRHGAFACLKKPLNLEKIVSILGRIGDRKRHPGEERPLALLRVENPKTRAFLEQVLRAHGCDTEVPAGPAEWRAAMDRGEMDILVWEVKAAEGGAIQRLLQSPSAYGAFEVILLLTEYGEAETAVQQAMKVAPVEYVGEPLEEGAVAAALARAHQRLLQRRSALYKKQKLRAGGGLVVCSSPDGGLVVDAGAAPAPWAPLLALADRTPWAWLIGNAKGDILFVSGALSRILGALPTRLDADFWNSLHGRGWVLPSLSEVLFDAARHGEGDRLPSGWGDLAVVPIHIAPALPDQPRLFALLFPAPLPPASPPSLAGGGFSFPVPDR